VTTPQPSKKKRVHPARKIVPRGRMGVGWVIAPFVLAALILLAGIALFAARVR